MHIELRLNSITLCQARLVPGWVTVLGRVNHRGMQTGKQVDSAWAVSPWVGKND